ncbi:MAG: hypothetical protein D6715_03365 [Calditrichaeota bacterium]|nr:MAG: hypothetical protein D6715_03365 [Calditrichota bacterium]
MALLKRLGSLPGLWVILLTLGLFSRCGHSSTACRQSFHLLFLTRSQPLTLWVGEDLSGECSLSRLVQVVLDEPEARTLYTLLEDYGQWQWLKRVRDRLQHFAVDSLSRQQNLWQDRSGRIQLSAPPADSLRMQAFWDHIAGTGSGAESWNRTRGRDGLQEPVFVKGTAVLRYAYPAGLYLNYQIDRVYLFPEAGLLVIFTRQEQLAPGLDTMNGFLVYQLNTPRL